MAPRWGVGRDASLLIGGQAVRAAGFTVVILGALLAARGYSHVRAALVLAALIAGTALASLVVGRSPTGSGAGAATRRSSSSLLWPVRWSPPAPHSGCYWSTRSPARCRPTWWTTARR